MTTIGKVDINAGEATHLNRYGTFYDYTFEGAAVDYESLAVLISKQRAAAVEKEIPPMSTKMRRRNAELSELGEVLAECNKAQANVDGGSEGSSTTSFSSTMWARLVKYFPDQFSGSANIIRKDTLQKATQLVKSRIDSLNNAATTDMARLQGLVDKRDDAFDTATNIMSKISGTRSTTLGAI